MGFSMGPEVEKDQTIRRLWYEGGEGIGHDQITPFRIKLINAYIDWRDFKIKPWDRRLEADQIPDFWKRVLRNFTHLEHDAQEYRRQKEAMKRKKPGGIGQHRRPATDVQVTDGGVPPTEEASQDWKAYRQKRLALQNKQRHQKHMQLQARQQRQQQQRQQQQLRQPRARPRQRRR
jgi:hypothetical protein